jgi:hypothetical protein
LKISEDQSAAIDIVTAEGDKVTLSADQHAEATLLTYEHLAYANTGYAAEEGQLIDYSEERNIALFVEGELNGEEIADIQALLADLGRLLKNFLTGKGEGGLEESYPDLQRYSSLSAVAADFEYHADMQYLNLEAHQLAVEAAGRPRLPETAPAMPPVAAIAPVAVQSPQPAAPAVALEATPQASASENDSVVREMAGKINESGLRPRRFMRLLKKFLRGLLKEMRVNHAIDDRQARRGESILEKFFDQLEKPGDVSKASVTKLSLDQQWVSRRYELKAEVQTEPSVEETV